MVRHFKTLREARKFRENQVATGKIVNTYKKIKGHKNRTSYPFVVCSEMEWLNLY